MKNKNILTIILFKRIEKVSNMAENKLPSGVGKKIVQALKKQAEIEIQAIPEVNEQTLINEPQEIVQESFEENIETENSFSSTPVNETSFNVFNEEDQMDALQNSLATSFEESFENNLNNSFPDFNFTDNDSHMFEEKDMFSNHQHTQKTYAMPANVAVLKRLIMQLPQGVTKQTGAQIIRQTMEALGISMSSVLKEAQQGQDSLTASAKACLTTIAEYKNNIKSLEKQVQDYKKQAIALNDLISLFIMTDK